MVKKTFVINGVIRNILVDETRRWRPSCGRTEPENVPGDGVLQGS